MRADESLRQLAPWRRFHVRITLAFGGLALALLAGMGFASYRWARDTQLAALSARLRALAITLAEGVDERDVRAALAQDAEAHARLVETFARTAAVEEDVQSIYVAAPAEREGFLRFAADWVKSGTPAAMGELYDAREMGEMRAGLDGPAVDRALTVDAWGASLSGYAPVRDGEGRAVGVLGVDVSAARVETIEERARTVTIAGFGAAFLVLAATGFLLGRSLRRPIARIVEASEAVASGDLSARVGLERKDELGILGRRFDRMVSDLEERERLRGIFGRYVSEEVARRALASPDADRLGGEEREVTVLFVDIPGFATLGAALEPGELVAMLERYLGAMTDVVEQHGGCVLELLGGAILAVFNAPEALEGHPAAAVRCGIAMQETLESLAREWEEGGLAGRWKARGVERVRARIGVHTGEVVAGNTGGKTRMKYAVIGDTVNVAARIQSLGDELGAAMLVSAEAHARVPEPLRAQAEARGEHSVKGRDRPVAVFAYRPSIA